VTQLGLFESPAPEGRSRVDPHAGGAWALQASVEAGGRLAARLPDLVRMGTSSWSFPGWVGLVYSAKRSPAELAREGLREYARHPLLRTVGVDRSFYGPISDADLRRYADQLPPGFPCCLKAPSSVTAPVVHGADRTRGGLPNSTFLSAEQFIADLLEPCARAFRDHCGPFVLEISPVPREHALDPSAFVERLDDCLDRLPRDFAYAVELRDRRLFTAGYRRVLARHAAAHVYNYWSAMPTPGRQAAEHPVGDNPFTLVRLLLKPGTWYEAQRSRFQPFDRLVAPDPVMRAEVTDLLLAAIAHQRPAYVLVNNKAEGSAPLTVHALAECLAEHFAADPEEAGEGPGRDR